MSAAQACWGGGGGGVQFTYAREKAAVAHSCMRSTEQGGLLILQQQAARCAALKAQCSTEASSTSAGLQDVTTIIQAGSRAF